MEAGHRGAGRENSMGLNIMLPFEQDANPIIAGDPKLVHMRYFFTRKLMFVKECDAVVCLAGGFGTLDELFEVVTLVQTRKAKQVPIVLYGSDYWKRLIDFAFLADEGVISPEDVKLFEYVDTPGDAWDAIKRFYAL